MNRNIVYVYPSVHGTTNVINFAGKNNNVNTMLSYFDVWGSTGEFKWNTPGGEAEVHFECSADFMDLAHTESVQLAFKRMGVELTFDVPSELVG